MLLFKYRSCEQRCWEILINRKLRFSTPAEMNDPLDSSVNIEREYERARQSLLHHEKAPWVEPLVKWMNRQVFHRSTGTTLSLCDSLQDLTAKFGILSMSKTATDPLLWSHYANGHRGVCLGFEHDELDLGDIYFSQSVVYRKRPALYERIVVLVKELEKFVDPETGQFHDLEAEEKAHRIELQAVANELLLGKSERWKYEEEFRFVCDKQVFRDFNPKSLKVVIFGWKTSTADRETMRNILKHSDYSHVRCQRVVHMDSTFEFDLESV